MTEIMLLNGPNLNLLGDREPEIYGYETLDDINGIVSGIVEEAGYQFSSSQSNAEHELIDLVHAGVREKPGSLSSIPAHLRIPALRFEMQC